MIINLELTSNTYLRVEKGKELVDLTLMYKNKDNTEFIQLTRVIIPESQAENLANFLLKKQHV